MLLTKQKNRVAPSLCFCDAAGNWVKKGLRVFSAFACSGAMCVAHGPISVGVILHCITHVAQNTQHCENMMQKLIQYIKGQHSSQGQYWQDCDVNIDETNVNFDMESGLTLADVEGRGGTASLRTRVPQWLGHDLHKTYQQIQKQGSVCQQATPVTFSGYQSLSAYSPVVKVIQIWLAVSPWPFRQFGNCGTMLTQFMMEIHPCNVQLSWPLFSTPDTMETTTNNMTVQ
jgi:hypothetical protein